MPKRQKRKAPKSTSSQVTKKKQKTTSSSSVVAEGGHSWTEKGPQFHKGRWTKQESEQLKSTVEAYAKTHHIEVATLAERRVKVERATTGSKDTGSNPLVSKKAWLDIANESGLELRTLQSIYSHGCRICDPRNYKGKWSEYEMKRLVKLVAKHQGKWGLIADELKRERRGVQEKWNKMERKKTLGTADGKSGGVKWTEAETRLLKRYVKQFNTSNSKWPVDGIEWTKVCAKVKGRSVASLRKKWVSVYTAEFPWTAAEESALAVAVQNYDADGTDYVPWARISEDMEGNYPKRVGHEYRLKFLKLQSHAKGKDDTTFSVSVDLVVNKFNGPSSSSGSKSSSKSRKSSSSSSTRSSSSKSSSSKSTSSKAKAGSKRGGKKDKKGKAHKMNI